jgi:hypothetical protein
MVAPTITTGPPTIPYLLNDFHAWNLCEKQFNTKSSRLDHYKSQHTERGTRLFDRLPPGDNQCKYPQCGSVFTSRKYRKVHYETIHHEGELLECEFCKRRFSKRQQLQLLNHLLQFHDQYQLIVKPIQPDLDTSYLKPQLMGELGDSAQRVAFAHNNESMSRNREFHETPQFWYKSSTWTDSIRERNELLGAL